MKYSPIHGKKKTLDYGQVCFKLLLYPGKTLMVQDSITLEERKGWQKEHISAWIPPSNKLHPSGREETGVRLQPRGGCLVWLMDTSFWIIRQGPW